MEQVKAKPALALRLATEGDHGFIARHWVDVLYSGMPKVQKDILDPGPFNRFHHQYMEHLLKRCEVRVVGPPNDDFTIYGAAVVSKPSTIHFVFVRPSWRGYGVARMLLHDMDPKNTSTTFTTWAPAVASYSSGWILNKYQGLKYVPYYMKDGDEERRQKREAIHGR